jgi:hypothetical protein
MPQCSSKVSVDTPYDGFLQLPTMLHACALYTHQLTLAHLFLSAGFSTGQLQACMERLVRLHQYAEAAEGFESLTALIFIKEKYAQSCWLKASMQTIPADAAGHAGAGQYVGVAPGQSVPQHAPQQAGVEDCADGVEPMQM